MSGLKRCRYCKRNIKRDALSTAPVFAFHLEAGEGLLKQCKGTYTPWTGRTVIAKAEGGAR